MYSFFGDSHGEGPLSVPFDNLGPTLAQSGLKPDALRPDIDVLTIKYCLAEPLRRTCHVGLSPTLLLAVTICVIVGRHGNSGHQSFGT